jgi:hypothetical protein
MAASNQTLHDPFSRSGAYGNDMLTMSGPIGHRRRRKGLVPGQTKMADGSTYQGPTMIQNLRHKREILEKQFTDIAEKIKGIDAALETYETSLRLLEEPPDESEREVIEIDEEMADDDVPFAAFGEVNAPPGERDNKPKRKRPARKADSTENE